jgi:GntR family transcriptional regulator
MQIHVTEHDGVPYYQQLVSQIKALIATGRLEPGEQLPPVRKLAEQLVINPNTVARSYRELESEGVVETRRGAGVFVANGASPLSRREIQRRLQSRIDQLLAEAHQMSVDQEALIQLIRKRGRQFDI